MRSPYKNPSLSHVLMHHHHVLSVKNRAANTTNVCGSLFQMSLLFQEILVNWFSPKLFPTLLCFLFMIRLLPQVWSVALMSPKDFQLPFMAFDFNSTHYISWLATTFKRYTQKLTSKSQSINHNHPKKEFQEWFPCASTHCQSFDFFSLALISFPPFPSPHTSLSISPPPSLFTVCSRAIFLSQVTHSRCAT